MGVGISVGASEWGGDRFAAVVLDLVEVAAEVLEVETVAIWAEGCW